MALTMVPLAVAIDPALTLLQAVGVPRQIVVQNGVEVLLEVDALAQAVGRHQHARRFLPQFRNFGPALSSPMRPVMATTRSFGWLVPASSAILRRGNPPWRCSDTKRSD